jgi:hypothetical protein
MNQKSLVLCVGILLAVGIIFTQQAYSATEYLAIGTCSPSSSQFGYAVGMSKAVNELADGINTTVVETGATVDNIKRMEKKQIDFGIVTPAVVYQAYNGIGEKWEGNAKPWLRMLWTYMRGVDNYVVREDSGIMRLEDLNGKKFNCGFRGSATETTCEAIFNALGIEPDLYRGGTTDAVQAIKDDRIAGYLKTGAGLQLDASTKDIMSFTPIRILPFNEKQIATIKEKMPWILWVDVPKGVVRGLETMDAYTSWGMAISYGTTEWLPEETAYKLLKAIDSKEGMEFQKAGYPGCFDDIPRTTLEIIKTPLHPGAVRYYRERGLTIPDHLIPPEMK